MAIGSRLLGFAGRVTDGMDACATVVYLFVVKLKFKEPGR
jgi:hypothetical protein